MKTQIKSLILGLICLVVTVSAQAVPINYSGELTSGSTRLGVLIGQQGALEPSLHEGRGYWSFFGEAGDIVDILVNRISSSLDPAMSIYFGTTDNDDDFVNLLVAFADDDFGGMTKLASFDDEIPVPTAPGPFNTGDPFADDFVLASTGFHTVVVGGNAGSPSNNAVSYLYQISITGNSPQQVAPVPEPLTLSLLTLGLGGITFRRRKQPLNKTPVALHKNL